MTTQAHRIADLFGNDGQNFTSAAGNGLEELVASKSTRVSRGQSTQAVRYEFRDGSSIVIAGAAWDLGLDDRECTCWAEVGHSEECDELASHIDYTLRDPDGGGDDQTITGTIEDARSMADDWAHSVEWGGRASSPITVRTEILDDGDLVETHETSVAVEIQA